MSITGPQNEYDGQVIADLTSRLKQAESDRESLRALVVRLREFISECEVAEDRSNLDGDSAEVVLQQINDGAEEVLKLVAADLSDCVVVKRREWTQIISTETERLRSVIGDIAHAAFGDRNDDCELVARVASISSQHAALEAENRALREELERHKKMEDMRFQVLPEPKNPTLWKYIDESRKHGVIDFHLRAERMADGGFKFYIHAAQASSSTEDFYIWPDPFSWHDMVANTKDIAEPDIEAFKKSLRKALAPKEGNAP